MSIRWTRTSVRSFVWNLTRSLFHFTSLFKFPVARFVGTKPTPAEPRATPANTPKTAAPTIAALNFFLKRNTRIRFHLSLISIAWSASVPGATATFRDAGGSKDCLLLLVVVVAAEPVLTNNCVDIGG